MKLIIISSDDWEAIYLDDECIFQDHEMERMEFVKLLESYGLKSTDIFEFWAEDEDDEIASRCGYFPDKLSELKGDYSV